MTDSNYNLNHYLQQYITNDFSNTKPVFIFLQSNNSSKLFEKMIEEITPSFKMLYDVNVEKTLPFGIPDYVKSDEYFKNDEPKRTFIIDQTFQSKLFDIIYENANSEFAITNTHKINEDVNKGLELLTSYLSKIQPLYQIQILLPIDDAHPNGVTSIANRMIKEYAKKHNIDIVKM